MILTEKLAREVRKHRGDKSLRMASDETGLAFNSIRRIEHCEQTPHITTLSKLCSWMGKPVSEFLDKDLTHA